MEESVAKTLINNISSFRPLSSGHAAKVELVKRYCRNIDEILDLLKIFLDEVASKISPDEKLNKVLEELNATINEAVELVGSWSHMMSKFYFVTQVESIITKMQSYLVELCNLLNSLVLRPEVNSISTYMKKLKHIHSEKISVVIREASRDLAGEAMPKPEILAKISDSLSLCTNQEMLMEAVALDKIKMKSSNSEYSVELDDINGIVELVSYMLDKHVEEKQLHTINGVPVPADFCCPLSLELMSDPVIVASGQTYERVFIRKWLDLGYSVCPKTRQTLGHTNLIPNYTVKQLIENWCEIHGIMLPDPVKLLNLSFPASLGLIYESASDEAPLSDSSPWSNKSRSPEQNHSVYVSHQKIPCSSNESHQDNLIHENSKPDDQIYKAPSLEDSNGSESDLSRLSLASSEAKGKSQCNERLVPNALKQLKKDSCQISDVGRHLQSNSSSDPGTSSASSSTNLELLGEDNVGAQVSSDSDAPEVPPEGPVANSSHVGSDFAPRLGGVSSRSQSIWRRPSDRIGPRIILSPSMDSRPDISGIETKVRKLIENLKSDCVELQREATGELRLLSRQSMENRIVIANCGAVAFLVSLLHSADPKTQENAVTVLLNLSLNDNNKIAIANAEAIEPLVHVLQTGNPEAKANSAATLFSLSVIEDNTVRIGRSGAIKPLVELLGHGTPQGKKDSATALFNLSIFHENKARIVQAGAVKHLVELMDPATGMVDKAVSVLGNLATLQEGRNAIAQAGGIPVLVEVVELGSARGKENAAAALLHLCTNSNRLCSLVLQEGAVPPLVALSQSGTPRAREKAQVLLSYFRSQRLGKSSRD